MKRFVIVTIHFGPDLVDYLFKNTQNQIKKISLTNPVTDIKCETMIKN